jgi:FKBP-type peptidyl-prolyl cis-trans isomerase FkpA
MHRRTLVLYSSLLLVVPLACSKGAPEPGAGDFKPAEGTPLPPPPTKLEIVDEKVGTGAEAALGNTVTVHYTGRLMNGVKFDSSLDHNKPFDFKLGGGTVIKGWDQGVLGMKVGGKRKLKIPPSLGYGEKGSPPNIPGNAGLLFDVELLSLK